MIRHQLLDIGLSPPECLDTGQSLGRLEEGRGALVSSPRWNPGVDVTEKYIPRLQERENQDLTKVLQKDVEQVETISKLLT